MKTASVHTDARYYEPNSGRFLSADPLGQASSPSLYDFAGGDPVNSFDPTGRCNQQTNSNSYVPPFGPLPNFNDPLPFGGNPFDPQNQAIANARFEGYLEAINDMAGYWDQETGHSAWLAWLGLQDNPYADMGRDALLNSQQYRDTLLAGNLAFGVATFGIGQLGLLNAAEPGFNIATDAEGWTTVSSPYNPDAFITGSYRFKSRDRNGKRSWPHAGTRRVHRSVPNFGESSGADILDYG